MPMDKAELDIVRRAFAKQIMAAAGVRDERIEAALAAVPRDLLGQIRGFADRARRATQILRE